MTTVRSHLWGRISGGAVGIYTSNEGSPTLIVDDSTFFSSFLTGYTINNNNTVALVGRYLDGDGNLQYRLVTGNGGLLTQIADTVDDGFVSIDPGAINDAGDVAYSTLNENANSSNSVWISAGGVTTNVAGTSGVNYPNFGKVAINNQGVVAYSAELLPGDERVLVGVSSHYPYCSA